MNERILSPQLLKLVQAAGPGYSQADPEWVKKFALLIVKECAGIDFRHKVGMTVEQDYNTSRVILEHFGVDK